MFNRLLRRTSTLLYPLIDSLVARGPFYAIVPEYFSHEACDAIIQEAEQTEQETVDIQHRSCNIVWLENDTVREKLVQLALQLNSTHFRLKLDPDISGKKLQYVDYNTPNSHFAWHADTYTWKRVADETYRRLTMVLTLSNPEEYESKGFGIANRFRDMPQKQEFQSKGFETVQNYLTSCDVLSDEERVTLKKKGSIIVFAEYSAQVYRSN